MPAPVTSPSPARTVNKAALQKPRAPVALKKTRIVRRRGRAKDAVESDDEFHREVGTDSESDDGDLSSLDSETDDSDTEPASENVLSHHHSHARALSSNEGARPVDEDKVGHLNGDVAPFFAPSGNWSEMVADENANGPADLPVIEFTEFNGQTNFPNKQTARSRKNSPRQRRSSSSPPTSAPPPTSNGAVAHEDDGDKGEESGDGEEAVSASTLPRRVPGQTARQAYQQRLETDPSYVPTVGGFWGHDDRLMDKDLRSLSGWWRGRWQGRGRGRGFPMRGGVRGGFHGRTAQENGDVSTEHDGDVPPVDRPWTHDGFEEMKQREEQRRLEQKSGHQENPSFRGGNRGGRGAFASVRGGRGGFGRGFAASPTRMRVASPLGRVWFTMKPELMWTKQHEGFLYLESALKPRAGQGPAYRIRLPGSQPNVIRSTQRSRPTTASTSTSDSIGSNSSDFDLVVRLPKRAGKRKVAADAPKQKAATPIEEVFTVRLKPAVDPIPVPDSTSTPTDNAPPPVISQLSQESRPQAATDPLPQPSIPLQLEQLSVEPQASDPERQALTEQAVLRKPSSDSPVEIDEPEPSHTDQRPVLAPLQTVFTPPPPPPPPAIQPSPVYGSPYGYALPHGIAVNQHGMSYEVATGRPVYLQPPPPPPMYNPRPLMHSHMPPPGIPFVPGHLRHSSAVSPDLLSQPPSHTPPMSGFIDPSTGTPIFSFPRQTSRIEIRAPTDDTAKLPKPSTRGPSGLRTTAAAFEPSRSSETTENGFYPSISSPSDGSSLPSYEITSGLADEASQQQPVPAMLAYGHYHHQQPYYYPEQPQYGYPSYVEMPQYDMYNMDQQAPQGTIYY